MIILSIFLGSSISVLLIVSIDQKSQFRLAKFEYDVTQSSIERKIADKRCQQEGSEYTPWLMVHEVPSRGRSHCVYHPKYGRECHLLSDGEYNLWLCLTHSLRVIDVREQYALLPQTETLAIAKHLNISHPKHPKTKYPIVMTTDFLLTLRTGLETQYRAISYKTSNELSKKRVLEKLEIERRFWEHRDISWCIVTEQQVNKTIIKNIKRFFQYSHWDDPNVPTSDVDDMRDWLTAQVLQEQNPLHDILAACDRQHANTKGMAQRVVWHLLATHYWHVDLTHPLDNKSIWYLTNRANLEVQYATPTAG